MVRKSGTDNDMLTKPKGRESSQQGDLKHRSSSECVLRCQVKYDPVIRGRGVHICLVSGPAAAINLEQIRRTVRREPPASR